MNKVLNICGRCMSFQLFSIKAQARCRQPWQQCPAVLSLRQPRMRWPCGTWLRWPWLGDPGRASCRPPTPHCGGKPPGSESLPWQNRFNSHQNPSREKDTTRARRSLAGVEAMLWHLAANLNLLPGFHTPVFAAAPWVCCFGCGVAPSSAAPGSLRVLIPKTGFEWELWGHWELGH